MLKKDITYTTLDGLSITEPFYFNLNKAEITKMELSADGNSLSEQLKRISSAGSGREIIGAIEDFIENSYGIRSDDGKRFIKKPELFEEFKQSEAYSVLFMEIATDAQAAADFINGLIPQDMPKVAASAATTGTPSEIARARSEASLQGHNTKQTAVVEAPSNYPTTRPDQPYQDVAAQPLTQYVHNDGEVMEQRVAQANIDATYSADPMSNPEFRAFVEERRRREAEAASGE